MEDCIKIYNNFLDRSQRNIEVFKKHLNIKYYFNLINQIQLFKDWRRIYHEFNIIYTLIQNSNYKKSIEFYYMDKNFTISYNNRRYFLLILFIPYITLKIKRGKLFQILRSYLIISALLCRENFDLRNYKIQIKI